MVGKVTLMTQAEYARHRGCSAVSVHKAVKAGRITTIDEKIDPAVADIQWAKNTRARAGAQPPGSPAGRADDHHDSDDAGGDSSDRMADYWEARSRREAAEAAIAEMKEAEMRGTLIRADAVRAAWASQLTAVRDALLQIPSRLAPVLAAESEMERVNELLEAELRQALQQLSQQREGAVA